MFVVQYLSGLVALAALSIVDEMQALDAVKLVAPLIVVAAANSIILVEGIPMVSEQFLRTREARGEARGKRETQQLWEDWNRRRLDAEKKGEEFNEPPPSGE